MNRVLCVVLALALIDVAAAACPAHAFAPTINWWTVDGGGNGYAKAGTYNLGGTSGQPDAGDLAGSPYSIRGGFWARGALVITAVEMPVPTDPGEGAPGLPKVARVLPAAPNPAGSAVRFSFELPNERAVVIRVFSVSGGLVRTVTRGSYPAGRHAVTWDGRESRGALVGQGIYVVRIQLGSMQRSQKLLIVR